MMAAFYHRIEHEPVDNLKTWIHEYNLECTLVRNVHLKFSTLGFANERTSQVVNGVGTLTESRGNFPKLNFITASNKKRDDNSQVINSADVTRHLFHLLLFTSHQWGFSSPQVIHSAIAF